MFNTYRFLVLLAFSDGSTEQLSVSRHGNSREETADSIAEELLQVPDVSMVTVEALA